MPRVTSPVRNDEQAGLSDALCLLTYKQCAALQGVWGSQLPHKKRKKGGNAPCAAIGLRPIRVYPLCGDTPQRPVGMVPPTKGTPRAASQRRADCHLSPHIWYHPEKEVVEDRVTRKFPSWEGWRGAPGWLNAQPKKLFSLPYDPNLHEMEKRTAKFMEFSRSYDHPALRAPLQGGELGRHAQTKRNGVITDRHLPLLLALPRKKLANGDGSPLKDVLAGLDGRGFS